MVSWLQIDVAASALLEMSGSEESVLHVVHPKPVEWRFLVDSISSILSLEVIPYDAWIARMQEYVRTRVGSSKEQLKEVPGLSLLDFFNGLGDEPVLETTKAVRVSPSLNNAERLQASDVEKWINYWKQCSLIQV